MKKINPLSKLSNITRLIRKNLSFAYGYFLEFFVIIPIILNSRTKPKRGYSFKGLFYTLNAGRNVKPQPELTPDEFFKATTGKGLIFTPSTGEYIIL
jgi:hypothetical protein